MKETQPATKAVSNVDRGETEAVMMPLTIGQTARDASERQSRRVVAVLIHEGAIRSASSRAPLHLAFPAQLAECWLPGLLPAQATHS